MNAVLKKLGDIGLIPVVKIEDSAKAEGLARALINGGIPCAEITFRSDAAAAAIEAIAKAFPDMLVGAGTVISVELAEKAVAAGAKFIVAPGFNPAVVDFCLAHGVPIVPGVNDPTEIEAALAKGLDTLKFFPAEASGGPATLEAFAGPFSQVSFIPTGGVTLKNLAGYARLPNVLAVGGSWMVKGELLEAGDWEAVTALCREAVLALHGFSFAHMGINQKDEAEASGTAALFALLGQAPVVGSASIFNGGLIEVMKSNVRGAKGHIGFRCLSVERALAYLEGYGIRGIEETAKREKGRLSFIYLDKEIGGFAIHLLRAK